MVKRLIGPVVCAIALASVSIWAQQAGLVRKAARPSAGRYIVVLHNQEDADAVGLEIAGVHRGRLRHTFRTAIKGFAIDLPEAAARRLAADPRVRFVEEDSLVSISTLQSGPSWGLDRIDQRALPLDQRYYYPPGGATVHVHIIDTGIRPTHVEFGGRAQIFADYVDDDHDGDPTDIGNDDGNPSPDGADCNGHGTHVAGTIGGETYGVAKTALLWGHRVLDCAGNGFMSSVIAAVDAVTASSPRPAVVNMSLGGEASPALDEAIRRSIAAGVVYVVAAGNENMDAAAVSPAHVTEAITVGATDSYDVRAGFSNYGAVLDLFAPGQGITSAWYSSDVAIAALSGTSMAAPHVAGVAALYLQANPAATPLGVRDAIVAQATPIVTNAGAGSPNLLVYSGFLVTDAVPPSVSISSPTNNATVNGIVTIAATATDDVAMAGVQFRIDGSNLGAMVGGAGPSYSIQWDSSALNDGPHTVSAVARDTGGNTNSAAVSVTIRNAPVISAVAVSGISTSGATVGWTTDKPATSQVAYGIASTNTLTVMDPALVTAHSVVLAGLAPATTYRYSVRSADTFGALATSAELTFRTAGTGATDPIGYWTFEDGTGLTAVDISGNGNNATLTGATFTAGKLGNGGVAFSGSGQYVGATGNNNSTFTTTAWFKVSGPVASWSGIVEYSTSTGQRRGMALDPTGRPVVTYGSSYRVSTASRVDDGAWHHLAATYDGTAAAVYVDGQAVGLGAAAASGPTSASRLRIGDLAFTGYYFKGVIDEVRLYDRALSPSEVSAVYIDSGSPPDTQAPTVPTNLAAAASSSTQIDLTWTPSTDNVAVTGYRIYRNGSQVATTAGAQYADTGLAPATTYSYAIAAYDAAGNSSGQTVAVAATTRAAPPDTTPPVLSGLSVTGVTSSSAVISWTSNEAADTQVEYGQTTAYGSTTALDTALRTSHSVTVSGLTPGTLYHARGRSTDAAQNVGVSTDLPFTTQAAGGSGPPTTGLIGYWTFEDGTGPTAVDSSGSGNNATLTGATFTAGKLGNGAVALSGSGQFVAASGNTNTTFTTAAWFKTSGPVTTWSGIVEYSTPAGQRRGMALDPMGKPVVTYGSAAYRVSTGSRLDDGAWHHLTATYDGTTAVVYADGQPVTLGAAGGSGPTSASRLRIGDLAFTGYYFKGVIDEVRLYDRALSPSEVAAVYTDTGSPPDTQAPTVPTNLAAGASSSTQVDLTWTPSTDNVAVSGYRIYRNSVQVGTATSPQYADTGLAPATTYSYAIAAYDAAGNSSGQTVAVAATTQAPPPDTTPPVLSGVSVTGLTSSSAVISWTTNESADTQVEYGPTNTYGSITPLDGTPRSSHSVTLSGLTPGALYHVRARSADAAQNLGVSPDQTFTTQTAGGSGPPTVGLIGYWAFEDGAGSTAVDSSGNGNNGTLTGATFTAGKLGNGGVAFSGSGQYVAATGNNNTTFTTTAWFRTSGPVTTWTGIVEYSTSTGVRRGMALDPTGKPVVTYGSATYRTSTGSRLDDAAWHHLAATYDGTTVIIYVDGQAVGLGPAGSSGPTTASRLRIGDLAFTGYYFRGVIDEVRLYDRALSPAEVTSIYIDGGTPQ